MSIKPKEYKTSGRADATVARALQYRKGSNPTGDDYSVRHTKERRRISFWNACSDSTGCSRRNCDSTGRASQTDDRGTLASAPPLPDEGWAITSQAALENPSLAQLAAIASGRIVVGMKNISPKQRAIEFTVALLFGLLCAGSAVATPNIENLLVSAGFKAKVATTAKQRQELKTLPEGTISPVTQKGKTFYIYPDAPRNQIYVGNDAQYQAYQRLTAKPRGSARPIVNTDLVRGNPIKVREFYGWEPFDDSSY